MGTPNWWDEKSSEATPPAGANGNEAITPTPPPTFQPEKPDPPAKKRAPATVEPGNYRILVRTPVLQWTGRKVEMMRRDILRFFHQMGAPNCEFLIVGKDGLPTNDEPQARLALHLQCKEDDKTKPPHHDWYATKFTPCPKCGGKKYVSKKHPKRIPLPEGASLVA